MPILQSEVRSEQAFAKPGQITRASHSYLLTDMFVVADGHVCVGCFAKSGQKDNEILGASGQAITQGQRIVGVVVADKFINGQEMTNTYPVGQPVAVVTKGSIAISTESAAKVGQFVFLKNDNGTLVFGDTDTLADHTFTGFTVTKGTSDQVASEEIIEITSL